ncbi:MAG: hypothetical protein RIM80_17135 [Alphaproteobacteria bacterium]
MMRNLKKLVLAGAALTLLAACQSTGGPDAKPQTAAGEAGGKRQVAADLTAYFAEPRRMRWENAAGLTGFSDISPVGEIRTDWGKGGDVGRWNIEGDAFCIAYRKLRNGAKTCAHVYAMPDGSRRSFDAATGQYKSTSWPQGES